ncbi:MAG: hypothetical protein IMY67_08260 [Bacteroidetes bacterium]|nr:hypothetical protein [Bacteroidota bacterium]
MSYFRTKNAVFSSNKHIKLLSLLLFCFIFSIETSFAESISGEYKNASESVVFDSSDHTAIINTKNFFGLPATVHGKYKVKNSKVYLFDISGKSLGTFTKKGKSLISEKGSHVKSLTKPSKFEEVFMGTWDVKDNVRKYKLIFGVDGEVVMGFGDFPKYQAGKWKKQKKNSGIPHVNIFFPSFNGKKLELNGYYFKDELTLNVVGEPNLVLWGKKRNK